MRLLECGKIWFPIMHRGLLQIFAFGMVVHGIRHYSTMRQADSKNGGHRLIMIVDMSWGLYGYLQFSYMCLLLCSKCITIGSKLREKGNVSYHMPLYICSDTFYKIVSAPS